MNDLYVLIQFLLLRFEKCSFWLCTYQRQTFKFFTINLIIVIDHPLFIVYF